MKKIKITSDEINNLKQGNHICVNGVGSFGNIIATSGTEEVKCRVQQLGGIFTKSASIVII